MGKKRGKTSASTDEGTGGSPVAGGAKWRPVGTGGPAPKSQPVKQAPSPFVHSNGDSNKKTAAAQKEAANFLTTPQQVSTVGRIAGSFIPPGCDVGYASSDCEDGDWNEEEGANKPGRYEDNLVKGFWCPPRLRGRNESLIEAVNDWHFAMLNDLQRNQFYWDALATRVKGKRVIDIGSGSGLLSLMAAKQGASSVLAIEAAKDMVELARLNIDRNGQQDKIRILHDLSSNVNLPEDEKADVIVSETLGALMLGEGMLDYLADARKRLAKPGAQVIPSRGAQYAVLISSASLAMVSSVQRQCSMGFDLSAIGSLQDTGNLFFTKQWGFRLNSIPDLVHMSERVCILDVDFTATERHHIPALKVFQLKALRDGVVHAVVASWEVSQGDADGEGAGKITTHPEDTKDETWGFARDMQWGQGLQLVEDFPTANAGQLDRTGAPAPFEVKAGDDLQLTVRFSQPCRQTFQFTLQKSPGSGQV